MASIASKNPYDLLGGDDGGEQSSEAPRASKAADKTATRGKENRTRGGSSRGSGGSKSTAGNTNEQAFRDRSSGSYQTRAGAPEENFRRDNRPRGRGGRGRGRGGPPRDDRHSKTGVTDHEKQVGHGWGANTGEAEWGDEKAGEAMAKEEGKEAEEAGERAATSADGGADAVNDEDREPEQKTKSLGDFLAEQAEKKLAVGSEFEIRRANEGSKKKFPEGKAIARNEEEENFIVGTGGKTKREREKKQKSVIELDGERMRPVDSGSDRRGRGGRGRGGDRGDRGERGEYRGGRGGGERRPRGDFKGERGSFRSGRGGRGNVPDPKDQNAFPSLGA